MDLKICNICCNFKCRIDRCQKLVEDDVLVVNHLLVVKCNGRTVSVEKLGETETKVLDKNHSSFDGYRSISEDDLPDHARKCLDDAINRTIDKLMRMEDFEGCEHMAEQLVSKWNE